MKTKMRSLGETIRDALRARKLAGKPCEQKWLSEQAGYASAGTISHILNGRHLPTDEHLRKIAKALDLKFEDLRDLPTGEHVPTYQRKAGGAAGGTKHIELAGKVIKIENGVEKLLVEKNGKASWVVIEDK